jgi:hypothetical protein
MSTSSAVLSRQSASPSSVTAGSSSVLEAQLEAYRAMVDESGLPAAPVSHEQTPDPVEWMASLGARLAS